MLEYIKNKALSMYINLSEGHFGVLTIILAIAAALIAVKTANPYAEIISAKLVNIALYLTSCAGFTALYGTVGLDVKKEIVKEHNIALGLIFLGLYVGLALCVFS